MDLTYAELSDSPLGVISFAAGDRGLRQVAFLPLKALKEQTGGVESAPSQQGVTILSSLLQEMNAYLFGLLKNFTIMVDWQVLDGFQARVLAQAAEIPFGEVMTYGEIARAIGQPGASRAVGRALGANPMPVVIPCHRVIGSDRQLRGYTGGLGKKHFLLTLEGHKIGNNHLLPK